MTTLLTSIKAALLAAPTLTYLKGVEIVPDYLDFTDSIGFPMVTIVDAGEDPPAGQLGGRLEHLKVGLGFYQAIASPEASVIGDGVEKGLLEMVDDVKAVLRSETFNFAYQAPFIRGNSGTKTLTKNFEDFLAFKSIDLEYQREVVEAT